MSKTVVGIFDNHSFAEKAAQKIKQNGFKTNDISILTKQADDNNIKSDNGTDSSFSNATPIHDNISDGVVTGTVLGGLAGLVIGVGTVIVPGLGVLAAAGPIVGLLSGAVTGGVVGGLIDLGIPEDDSTEYENDIKSGKILLSMLCSEENTSKISDILKNCGATKVESY